MSELFAQIGQAYQPTGTRPIPTDWPRQNPVSWVDPATGMTPGQFGQGLIGAGKEIPNLMWSALPRQEAIDPKTGRAFPTPALFPPRGREQETGARMMDILSWLHGMNPVGMEEAVPRVPRYEEDFPPSTPEWWEAMDKYGPQPAVFKSLSDQDKRMYQFQQALLNRAQRGEKAIPAKYLPQSMRPRSTPLEAPPGAEEYPPGSIGAEAQSRNELLQDIMRRVEAKTGELMGKFSPQAGDYLKQMSDKYEIRFGGSNLNPIYTVWDRENNMSVGDFSDYNEANFHMQDRFINETRPKETALPRDWEKNPARTDSPEEIMQWMKWLRTPEPRDIQSWKWPEEYLERMPRDHKGLLSPKNPPKYEFGAGDYYPSNGNGH